MNGNDLRASALFSLEPCANYIVHMCLNQSSMNITILSQEGLSPQISSYQEISTENVSGVVTDYARTSDERIEMIVQILKRFTSSSLSWIFYEVGHGIHFQIIETHPFDFDTRESRMDYMVKIAEISWGHFVSFSESEGVETDPPVLSGEELIGLAQFLLDSNDNIPSL